MENDLLNNNNKKAAEKLDEERKANMLYVAFTLRQLAGQQAKVIQIDTHKKQSA